MSHAAKHIDRRGQGTGHRLIFYFGDYRLGTTLRESEGEARVVQDLVTFSNPSSHGTAVHKRTGRETGEFGLGTWNWEGRFTQFSNTLRFDSDTCKENNNTLFLGTIGREPILLHIDTS
jgi:hypothetical protein